MLTKRQINHLNRLAQKEAVMFDGGDGLIQLTEIRFLKFKERGQTENVSGEWAVFFDDYRNWYYLKDCKFFTLRPYGNENT